MHFTKQRIGIIDTGHDFKYMTFWKRQTTEVSACQLLDYK